jgi:hypothetical protein
VLTKSIRLLSSLAQKLKLKRMDASALNLASPEVKIHLDSAEFSDPIDVEQKELRETDSSVEEFMLLANISVGREIPIDYGVEVCVEACSSYCSSFLMTTFNTSKGDIYLHLGQTLKSFKIFC